ncbi:MAG TPA: glycoside hydrolase family 43 protein [Povalibacter sp.]|nr:glycoside hydrolase family 43 protein [Povalibacter sp.]
MRYPLLMASTVLALLTACHERTETAAAQPSAPAPASKFVDAPLVTDLYTADPSAHVFDGRLWIYPSHDIESNIASDGQGAQFDMRDYHVYSMDRIDGPVTDHGVALDLKDIPWASRQLWAPDAARKDGTYYLYFPAKDHDGVFRIGVASSTRPEGPFKAQPEPIAGTYSMDPSVFEDDGHYYLILGGLRGGQLQRWATGTYQAEDTFPEDSAPALVPKMARLNDDMTSLAEDLRPVVIQDEQGKPLTAGDKARAFFEAAWLHKYDGKYYLSYSTGDTHFIAYAMADSVYGPYTYRGVILKPVVGWTTHHSIVEFNGQWYLFYHDAQLTGKTHLRNMKVTTLHYNDDGTIQTIEPMRP